MESRGVQKNRETREGWADGVQKQHDEKMINRRGCHHGQGFVTAEDRYRVKENHLYSGRYLNNNNNNNNNNNYCLPHLLVCYVLVNFIPIVSKFMGLNYINFQEFVTYNS